MDTKIEEVILTKVNLEPGDVLFATIKTEYLDEGAVKNFRDSLKAKFPNNEVVIIGVGENDKFELVAVKNVDYNQNRCENCTCGAKT